MSPFNQRRLRRAQALLLALSLAAAASLGSVGNAEAASLLYGVRNPITPILITIEPMPPFTRTEIGALGVPFSRGGLAYDRTTNTLYGINDQPPGNLYQIDLATGAATLIGPHGIDPAVGNGDLRGLAFDTTNNILYGAAGAGVPGDLYMLDPLTGAATHVGELPPPGSSPQVGGLAYDSRRDMLIGLDFGTGDLWTIDRVTPSNSSLLADLSTAVRVDGFTYDSVHDLFWATDALGELYSFDPSNGYERTAHGGSPSPEIAALAFVPEPSSLALIFTAMLAVRFCSHRGSSL